jgi:antitoxin VapB
LALRLPKALGIKEGTEMKVREEDGNLFVEPAPALDAKIDLTGIYGSIPGIRRPPCDDNPRDWDPAARNG